MSPAETPRVRAPYSPQTADLDWKDEYEKLLAKAKADDEKGDAFFLKTKRATMGDVLYALLLAYAHLERDKTFARAVEYCGTVRMITHEFFELWDGACGLPRDFMDVIAWTIKKGNQLLEEVNGQTEVERDKLGKYRKSCHSRWDLYRRLREEGREAVRQFLAQRAEAILKDVQPLPASPAEPANQTQAGPRQPQP